MRISLIILFIFIFSAIDVPAADEKTLREDLWLLQSELTLAKKPKIYLIFNLKKREILIKWRGVFLRQLKVDSVALWGKVPGPKPLLLQKRRALFEPGRKEIIPETIKDEDSEIPRFTAIEIDDMPSTFRLLLGGGISISVRERPEGTLSRVRAAYHKLAWYSTRPAHSVWNLIRGKSSTSIYIMMEKREAQSLYWVFHEGLECIVN